MNESYERDLDLNLLRVFAVVCEEGSVTAAADRLYLTQPAVSAALKRLAEALEAQLFVRKGRRLTLTARGEELRDAAVPALDTLVRAARQRPTFDAATEERPLRIGLADDLEAHLLPSLMRRLDALAPKMPVIVRGVTFRDVAAALDGDVEVAVTVADALPSSICRKSLLVGGFVCLYDPAYVQAGRRITEKKYFASGHVIVTYAGDLRGIVEDSDLGTRRVRCAVPRFHSVGALVEGTDWLATLPQFVADAICAVRPLRTAKLPFPFGEGSVDMLWPRARDDDPRLLFVREQLVLAAVDAGIRARAVSSRG